MKTKLIKPPQTIGILGGGQLGRMMAISAKEMGFRTAVLDPKADSPLGQVADYEILSDYDDLEGAELLKQKADVVTYEFENVDLTVTEKLKEESYLPQGSYLLEVTRDRLMEKGTVSANGVPVTPYAPVMTADQFNSAIDEIGFPSVLKTTRGGYDGKGQWVLKSAEEAAELKSMMDGDRVFILEKWIPFEKEMSVIVTRSTNGETTTFPVAENVHVNNILHHSIVPARISQDTEEKAKAMAIRIADTLQLVGTLAVEMFLTAEGEIFVNELAPRPHNSGHYTIEACETSQFRQHIRAICGWPLLPTDLLKPVVCINILGQHMDGVLKNIDKMANMNVHLYGKDEAKTGRKMGHVTVLAKTTDEALKQLAELNIWPDLEDKTHD